MLKVTDLVAVNEIFNNKAPRPFGDVMREIYPDAVEDKNGRFHAPHDGYICPITNREFRGGEYLPGEEPEEGYRIISIARKFPQAVDALGVVHSWDGSRAQNMAVWGLLIEQTRAHDTATSEFVGAIGEKITIAANVVHIHEYQNAFGSVFINILKDECGNVVIYKGSKILAKKGENIKISAKVKLHSIREGVKQTTIERPKVI